VGVTHRPRMASMETETEVAGVEIAFDERGLVPCITQDWATGEVLTLAYMNREALDRTLSSGEVHFWSRSRDELWRKGETSGNVQRVRSIRYDCDADALLALVDPTGPACHTGERTCFYRTLDRGTTPPRGDGGSEGTAADLLAPHEALPALGRTLERRREEMPEGSYSAELFRAGPERIGAKVEEEAEETARAGRSEADERLRAESADLLYHLGVLLYARGMSYADVLEELTKRMDTPRTAPSEQRR
jgi:phosphoribosyl-ATP pyrophosphohydrolase/phosphoribosyl-AMP cyclohydrolase